MALFTLVNLWQNLASQHPVRAASPQGNRIAYTFLEDGEKPSASLTYRSLDEKARAIAAYLQSQLSVGDRVLLVYPQGLESIAAFFGCLYAGVVAIPVPAPSAARLKRILPRLEAIAADAGASLILTTANDRFVWEKARSHFTATIAFSLGWSDRTLTVSSCLMGRLRLTRKDEPI